MEDAHADAEAAQATYEDGAYLVRSTVEREREYNRMEAANEAYFNAIDVARRAQNEYDERLR